MVRKLKGKTLNLIALAGCFVFLTAAIGILDGKWSGVMTAPDGNEYPVTYEFKVSGDTLTGTALSPSGSVALENGKVSGDTSFSFQMDVGGVMVMHTGKIYADSCGLDIDYQGMKFHTTLRRVTDK